MTDFIANNFYRWKPFMLFKGYFNFFRAFVTSSESGISVASNIYADQTGIPDRTEKDNPEKFKLTTNPIDNSGNPNSKFATKDSIFGLEYQTTAPILRIKSGFQSRVADIVHQLKPPPYLAELEKQYLPYNWLDIADHYSTYSPFLGLDFGLIVVLVNDDLDSGVKPPGNPGFVAVSLGRKKWFLDCEPNFTNLTWECSPKSRTRLHFNKIMDTLIHEIGHSYFNLRDEYSKTVPGSCTGFTTNPNIHLYSEIKKTGATRPGRNPIDPSKIKWNTTLFPGTTETIIPTIVFNRMSAEEKPLYEENNWTPGGGWSDHNERNFDTRKPQILSPLIYNTLKKPVKFKLIGVYEGGCYNPRDIYTPAGQCLMRMDDRWKTTLSNGKTVIINHSFCYVCMNIIVRKLANDLGLPEGDYLEKLARRFDPVKEWRKSRL